MLKSVMAEKILLEFDPQKNNLLLALKKINAVFGYISKDTAEKVAEYFSLPISQIYETASFYDLINLEKTADLVIKICSGADCVLGGANKIISEIENYFKIKAGDKFNPKISLEIVSCLGMCSQGPVVVINGKIFEKVTTSRLYEILNEYV
jgi:NADH-quinone oxidoreductase subunit E